eukprot:6669681-Prymnesium_polylepis.1
MRVFLLLLSAVFSGGQTGAGCESMCSCNSERPDYSSKCEIHRGEECGQGGDWIDECGNCAGCGASSTGDPHL